jgi:hypothetical protein
MARAGRKGGNRYPLRTRTAAQRLSVHFGLSAFSGIAMKSEYNSRDMSTLFKQSPTKHSSTPRRKRVDGVLGKYADVQTSSVAFAAAKHAEMSKENKRR